MSVEAVRRQSLISLVWSIAFTGIGFLSTVYFTRILDAGVLGGYYLFLAYFGVVSIICDSGFTGAVQKRISEGETPNEFFTAFFVMRSGFVAVVLLVLLLLQGYFVDLSKTGVFRWLILGLIFSMFQVSIHAPLGGRGKMGVYTTAQFVNNISKIFIQVIAVFLGYGVAGLVGGFIAGMIISALIELKYFDLKFVRFNKNHIQSLSSFSFWSFLSSASKQVFTYADTMIIGYYLLNADVGIYNIILQFVGIISFASSSIRLALWPRISYWGKHGNIFSIENSISKAFTFSLILAIPIVSGAIILGDHLLYFIYGEVYNHYVVLIVLLFAELINIFNNMFIMYLNALDYVQKSFKITILGTSANIIVNLLLVPFIGIEGAAVSTLITMSLSTLLSLKVLSSIININFEKDSIINILKASSFMSVLVIIYRLIVPIVSIWHLAIPVIFGGFLYVFSLFLLDENISHEFKKIIQR